MAAKNVQLRDDNATMLKVLSGLTGKKMAEIANEILSRGLKGRLKAHNIKIGGDK